MSKETSKKTGVSKLGKDKLNAVAGGYNILVAKNGVQVTGYEKHTKEFVYKVFDNLNDAFLCDQQNLRLDGPLEIDNSDFD